MLLSKLAVAISSNLYLMRALNSYSMEEYSAPKANALDNILRYLKRF